MRASGLLRWIPPFAVMTAIFLFSSLPAERIPFFGEYDLWVKKGGHVAGYAMLGVAYFTALPGRLSPFYRGVVSLLMAVLFALSDEFHQSFVRGRTSALRDVGIDTVGAAVALFLAGLYSSNSSSRVAS